MNKKKITYYFLLFFFFNYFSSTANTADSLLSLLESPQFQSDPKTRQNIHFELGQHYYYSSESFEEANDQYKLAMAIAREHEIKEVFHKILYELGKCQKRLNNYPQALECYFELIEMENPIYSIIEKGKYLGQISPIYQALGNYDKAFQFQMQSLSIHEKENNKSGICESLYNLGSIFYYQKRFDQSLEFYQRSKKVCDETKNNKAIYACLDALGSVYSQIDSIEKSDIYALKALELAKKINYKTGIAYSQGNIATDLAKRKQYHEAEKLHIESIKLKKELNDIWGQIGGLTNLAEVYFQWNKPERSIQPLQEALQLSNQIESKTRVVEVYKSLNEIYHSLQQTDSAYFYLEKYVVLKDSLLNEKTVEEMGKAKNLYEIEKKEQEIALLKTKSENQQLQQYIFIIVGIFMLLVWWGIFSRLKFQRATNQLLEEKNEEIQIQNLELQHAQDQLLKTNILLEDNNLLLEDKNEEIETKNKLLEESNDDLQNFAYIASHDLKEPLRMISSYTTLIKKRYHDKLDETGQEFMHYVVDGADRMKTMLDDLLNYSRVGKQRGDKTWVDMSDIMVIVNSNLTPRLFDQNATLVIKEKNLPAIKGNKTQMLQLMQNLVSNGIKFRGETDPVVTVDCRYDNDKYIFSVADNGIGISEENIKIVFEMFKRLHSKEEYEGTGIGLATCKKIVSNHEGEIWIESTLGKGSTFFFSIPCPIEQPDQSKPNSSIHKKLKKDKPSSDQLMNSQADR